MDGVLKKISDKKKSDMIQHEVTEDSSFDSQGGQIKNHLLICTNLFPYHTKRVELYTQNNTYWYRIRLSDNTNGG